MFAEDGKAVQSNVTLRASDINQFEGDVISSRRSRISRLRWYMRSPRSSILMAYYKF